MVELEGVWEGFSRLKVGTKLGVGERDGVGSGVVGVGLMTCIDEAVSWVGLFETYVCVTVTVCVGVFVGASVVDGV